MGRFGIFIGSVGEAIRRLTRGLRSEVRASATGFLVYEHKELENLFALMVYSSIVGIPGPPSLLSLMLLPHTEREVLVLLDRARESGDPLGEIFSLFEVV